MHSQHYNFFKYVKITSGFSIVILIFSVLFFGIIGLNYGIDFKGGSMIMVKDQNSSSIRGYRQLLNSMNLGDFNITEVFDPAKSLGQVKEKIFLIQLTNIHPHRVRPSTLWSRK